VEKDRQTARSPVKVLHVQKAAGIGGSERHLLSLLPALARSGLDVRMLIAATDEGNRLVEALGARAIPLRVVPAGPHLNPALVAALAREIHAFRPDIVHTHLVHADIHGQLATAASRAVRVSSVHSTPAFYRRQPFRTGARLAGHRAGAVIASSEHVRGFIEDLKLVPADRVHVVHYGIDASGWPLDESERLRAREQLGLHPADVAVGIAARLIPGKGHLLLLEAVADARRENAQLRLLVAGRGPLRTELEREAERIAPGATAFVGFVEDVRAFMNACDVLAFPTQPALGEGFGLAALEAMACGRPVVATEVASLPELVSDGETGFLVDPGSVGALAAALAALAGDRELRERLGARGQERARTTFSLERMVEGTLEVYHEAIGRIGARRLMRRVPCSSRSGVRRS
jgi:glycosyltransferase involved in cell wall biosynthesis